MNASARLPSAARLGLAVAGCIALGVAVLWTFVGFFGAPCDGSEPDCRPDIATAVGMVSAALASAAFLAAGVFAILGAGTGSRRWATTAFWSSAGGLLGVMVALSVLVPS